MKAIRGIFLAITILCASLTSFGQQRPLKDGWFVGGGYTFYTPVEPDYTNKLSGDVYEYGFGYHRNLLDRLAISFGYFNGNVYNYRSGNTSISHSVSNKLSGDMQLYIRPHILTDSSGIAKENRFGFFISSGLDAVYWSNQPYRFNSDVPWEGINVLTTSSVGFSIRPSVYTFIQVSAGACLGIYENQLPLQGYRSQIRLVYDFHRKAQREQLLELNNMKLAYSNIALTLEATESKIKADSSDRQYVVQRYEALVLKLAREKDSIRNVLKTEKKTSALLQKELEDLTIRHDKALNQLDSIKWNSWDKLKVIQYPDSALVDIHSSEEMKGAFYYLYTGDMNQVTTQLYSELHTEYPDIWIVGNDFGAVKIVTYVPKEKEASVLPELTVAFPDLDLFDRTPLIR